MKLKTVPRMCTNVPRMRVNRESARARFVLITPYEGQSDIFCGLNYPVCVHLLIYHGG